MPMYFESLDEQDRPIHVAILRGTFDILPQGGLSIAVDQQPVVTADQYHGQPLTSSVRVDTDLVPKKYHADITLNAVAHAPGGLPSPAWEVGVSVGKVSKRLRVTGPRKWQLRAAGWELSRPEPCREVPLRYEYAFGGTFRDDEDEVRYELNPVGRGFTDTSLLKRDEEVPAPQVEDPNDPIRELERTYRPAGFGPSAKHCLPRRQLCGTADETWKAERWPLRPRDFDFNYYNSAPAGLRYDGFLHGREEVAVVGCSPHGPIRFALPGCEVTSFAVERNLSIAIEPMKLDTLHIDLVSGQLSLTWRATFTKTSRMHTLHFIPGRCPGSTTRSVSR
jgi:hypothetical protein